ncbi:MAG: hypothetical protein J6R25_00595 [Bacteroidales bacterium]|nr:hypothetical protein [Bacteroidales bacterium]
MTPEELEKNLVLVVNSYYNIIEASDLLLREAERLLNIKGATLKQRQKQRHKWMMGEIDKLRRQLNESLMGDYEDAFCQGFCNKFDEVRRAGNYLARVILQIADRCGNDDTGAKEQMIEEFIASMPDGGYLNEEIKNSFYLK